MVLWPNASAVLARLGLLAPLQSVASTPPHMRRVSWRGDALGAIDIRRIDSNMGYPSLALLRRDLQRVMLSRLDELGVKVQYKYGVVRIESDGADNAQVRFDNGEQLNSDVIIAADGRMRSQGRLFVRGDNTPLYQGFVNWIGVVEWEQGRYRERDILDFWGIGQRFGIVPVSANKAYWAAGIAVAPEQADVSKAGCGVDIETMQQAFANWPQAVCEIVESSAARDANKIYVHDLDPCPLWHKGNLLMIGDAAHAPLPTSGQGACQAIEDAWFLAQCLSQNQEIPLQQRLDRFSRSRMEKTSTIIHAARGFATSLYHRDPDYCAKRDQASRASDFDAIADAMANLWALQEVA